MEPLYVVLLSCLASLIGLSLGYAGARLLDRSRLKSIRTQAEAIAKMPAKRPRRSARKQN